MDPAALVRLFGFGGTLAALAGVLVTGAAYVGTAGERYSPLNHFISELGEEGVSPRARVFNLSLMLAGLLLLPFCVVLGLLIPGWLSKLGMAAGVGAAIALGMVGVYPMNRLTPHIRAAQAFFRLGLAMALLFTVAIAVQGEPPVVPRLAALAGLPAIVAYTAFIIHSAAVFRWTERSQEEAAITNRPRVWALAILEWLVFLTTTLWFGLIALGM